MTDKIAPTKTSRMVNSSQGRIVIPFTASQSGTVILKRMNVPEAQEKCYPVAIQGCPARNGQIVYAAASPPLLSGTYAIICPSNNSIIKTVMVFAGTTAEVSLNGNGYNWNGYTGKPIKSDRQRQRVRRYYACRDTNGDHSASGEKSLVKVKNRQYHRENGGGE